MSETLKVVLSLSLSGSLLILILLLCKPLFKDRISKRWQYYIWLVVIARLLLPITPETSLVGALFQDADRSIVRMEILPSSEQGAIADAPQPGSDTTGGNFAPQNGEALKVATPTPQAIFGYILQNLWLIWLVVALILLIRKITIYQGFVKYIKAGRAEVSDTAILDRLALIGEQAGVKKPIELYTNSLISSPLLLGFFRPCIVLPTADLPDSDFEYIILHELTHYKRRDMFYKWLVQLAICLHWFNSLAYLMGREISRLCELACDETVIRKLDTKKQRDYGDTLLNAILTGGDYRDSLASMTLNESKELLKERLAAIMKFKNPSKVVKISTAFLTITVIFGATFTGAYAAAPNQAASTKNVKETGTVVFDLSSDRQNSIHHSSSFEAKANQTLVLDIQSSIIGGTVDFFLFSPTGQDRRITIGGSDKTETVTLTAGRWAYNCTGFFDSGSVTINGRLSNDSTDTKSLGQQEKYNVNIEKIGVNEVVCIGQISLTKDVAYRFDITAQNGDGLFVGLQSSNEITSSKGVPFDQRYGTASRAIHVNFKSAESESCYVYVGNEGDTNLTEIKGVLAKENTAISDQKSSPENMKTAETNTVQNQNGNWNFFSYTYLNGYMIGIGSRAKDNLQNYSQIIQLTVNDKEYSIAFYEQAKPFAKDDKFIKALQVTIADIISQGWRTDQSKGSFLIVNQVIADKTADELYGYFCEQGDPIALQQLTAYVKKETIEKYIAKAYEDNNEMLMMLILTELPDDFIFNADDLAWRAISDGRQMMYLHLSRFVSPAVRKELDEKMFGSSVTIPPLPPVPPIDENIYDGQQQYNLGVPSIGSTSGNTDAKALDIMQRTGNWGYIEAYLPEMTNAGIDAVVNSYNSKHPNSNEHKKASNYYN